MGKGKTDDAKGKTQRQLSAQEQLQFWQSRYLQQKAENDFLRKENIVLNKRIRELEKMLQFKRGDEV